MYLIKAEQNIFIADKYTTVNKVVRFNVLYELANGYPMREQNIHEVIAVLSLNIIKPINKSYEYPISETFIIDITEPMKPIK